MNTTAIADVAETVADTLTDVWSSATNVAANEAERVSELVGRARERVHPAPKRSLNPWLLVALAAAVVTAGWWMRRRRAAEYRPDVTTTGHSFDPQTTTAHAAAGS